MHAMWPYNADDQLRNQDVQSRAAEQLLDLVSQKRREIKMWMTGLLLAGSDIMAYRIIPVTPIRVTIKDIT